MMLNHAFDPDAVQRRALHGAAETRSSGCSRLYIALIPILLLVASCALAPPAQHEPLQSGQPGRSERVQPEIARFTDARSYADALRNKVRANVVLPIGIPDRASASVELRLTSAGAVADLTLARSSGYPAYDEAVQDAIRRAEPLPVLIEAGESEPTRLLLVFRVKE
jgi:TonB family protein